MAERVLVTGGAGFIGCHIVRALLDRGDRVRVFDSLIDQVHHGVAARNPVLDEVELIRADVRDLDRMTAALEGVDSVIHLAAEVGVGQSMYAIDRYVSVNDSGTAVLFQALIDRPVRRVVVASSMSVYGEGLYRTAAGERLDDVTRLSGKVAGGWNPLGPDGAPLTPIATPEWKRPNLASVYALTKYVQERLTLTVAPAYGMEGVALRLFNVYGPGQALSNPYTGVLAIFASRLQNLERPMVFEDGEQRRDFVHVEDVARAFLLALDSPAAAGQVFNIGSGNDVSILEVGAALARAMGVPHLTPEVMDKARVGDIRHCFGDISLAREVLGFAPRRSFDDSLGALADWVRSQQAEDKVQHARDELERRGLVASMNARPILITGGAGFIGSNIANCLAGQGHRVRIYDVLARPGVEANLDWLRHRHGSLIEPIIADIRDAETLDHAVQGAEAVFHMAAQVAVTTSLDSPMLDFDVNLRGTMHLLEALRRHPVPMVFASTNKVYGDLGDVALTRAGDAYLPEDASLRGAGIDEARPLSFYTPYGCSKGAADQYVLDYARSFGIPACVMRMSCIYGPRQRGTEDQGWLAHFLYSVLAGRPISIYGDGRQVRDVMFVDDAVDAYLAAWSRIDQVTGQAFNLGGGPANAVTLLQVLAELGDITGHTPDLRFSEWRPGDQRYFVADTGRATAALDLAPPVDWRDGLRRLAAWVQSERVLEGA